MAFLPREEKFFTMLEKISQNVVLGAVALEDFLVHLPDMDHRSEIVLEIEHEGDMLTHEIIEALNRTFITPFDREDIHALAARLDDILDYIEAAADRCVLYKVGKNSLVATKLARVIVESTQEVSRLVGELKNLKHPRRILDRCIEINRLENEGDKVLREALADLFSRETNAFEAMKWKEIYENLEAATDRCEDVANIVEAVVIKYA